MARAQGTYRGERRRMVRIGATIERLTNSDKKFRDIWPNHTLDCQSQPDPGMRKTEKRVRAGWIALLQRAANATVGKRA